MPVFRLSNRLQFPLPHFADADGLLAFGGDLSPQRLLLAYRMGIFPWYNEDEPILWWSPNPRMVLYPSELKIAKSMHQILRNHRFSVTFDTNFADVIAQCRHTPRNGQGGTWINDDMQTAYCQLHELGYAHSVEVRNADGKMVGGLYGLALGRCYFGESMFASESNASKVGFITLVRYLLQKQYALIDCQVRTDHLASLGARMVERTIFLQQLSDNLKYDTHIGKWTLPSE